MMRSNRCVARLKLSAPIGSGSLRCVGFAVVFLVGAGLQAALAAESPTPSVEAESRQGDSVPMPDAAASREHVPERSPSTIPQLPAEQIKKVEAVEQDIDRLMTQADLPTNDVVQSLITAAEWVVGLREQYQGAHWWETGDAHRRLTELHRWIQFSPATRVELAQAVLWLQQADEQKQEGHYAEARSLYERVLAINELTLGASHQDTATSLFMLAALSLSQKQYTEARSLLERALIIRKTTLGTSHPYTAACLYWLAYLYQVQGQYAEARPFYEQALAIVETTRGSSHPDTATTLNNLAILYQNQGQYTKAQPLLERVLAINEATLGSSHLDTARSLSDLARVYSEQELYAEARPLLERVVAIREATLGPSHLDTARSLSDLAGVYSEQKLYTEARPLYERVVAIREATLGPSHPDTGVGLYRLANLYEVQGHYAEAQPLYERVLAICETTYGVFDFGTGNSLYRLAEVYEARELHAEARPLYERALAIFEATRGPVHPDTALVVLSLAKLYRAQGLHAEARPLYERALAISEQTKGPTHPDAVAHLISLGWVLVEQQQHEEAESLFKRALAINEATRGPAHPDTAESLDGLAGLYEMQGLYAQAQPLYERALAIRESTWGATHLETAKSLSTLARVYNACGRATEARPLYERVRVIYEATLGSSHPDTGRNLHSLAIIYERLGEFSKAQQMLEQALVIQKQQLGHDHSETLSTLSSLLSLYRDDQLHSRAVPRESVNLLPLVKEILARTEQVGTATKVIIADALFNLGILYYFQGQYAEARPQLERALVITETIVGPTNHLTGKLIQFLALIRSFDAPDEQAAQLLLRATRTIWYHLTKNFPMLSGPQQHRFLAKNLVRGEDYFWRLFAAVPGLDRRVGLEATLLSKQLLTEVARHESAAVQQVLAQASPAWRALWQERQALRRQYATHALHSLEDFPQPSRRDSITAPAPTPEFRQLADRLEQLDQQLRREHPAYAQAAQLEAITVEQVQHQLRPRGEALLEYVRFHPLDAHTHQLSDTWHYGVYVLRGGAAPVVAVDLGDAEPIDMAIGQVQASMRAAIERFKGLTPSPGQVRNAEAALAERSARVRALVWQPLEGHLRGVNRVYVAPDGPLSLLPFEVLAKRKAGGAWQYLVEERELIYLTTGRDLARLGLTSTGVSPTHRPRTAALVGNPAFQATPREVAMIVAGLGTDGTRSRAVTPGAAASTLGAETLGGAARQELPRTWQPVPVLDTFLKSAHTQLGRAGWTVDTLQHEQAVEEAVLRLQAPQIVQFATHGYLLDRPTTDTTKWRNPLLRSMLLLTGVNQADPAQAVFYRVGNEILSEAEVRQRGLALESLQDARVDVGDGVLTAYEVTGMNLQGTELVNLTACETGLGDVTPEGIAGLRQAFFLAGARALTMSMWEVPADETTHQIEAFYRRWLGDGNTKGKGKKGAGGMPRYRAFRQTQQAALAQARETYGGGHPFYWAGVIYLGDPGDLPADASTAARPRAADGSRMSPAAAKK